MGMNRQVGYTGVAIVFLFGCAIGFFSASPHHPENVLSEEERVTEQTTKSSSTKKTRARDRSDPSSDVDLMNQSGVETTIAELQLLPSEFSLNTALSSLPLTFDSYTQRKEIFLKILRNDPSAANALAAMIEGMPALQADQARQSFLAALAEVLPHTALTYLKEKKLYDNLDSIGDMFDRLGEESPRIAMELAKEIGPLASRKSAFKALLPHALDENFKGLSSLEELTGDPIVAYDLLGEALQSLAAKSPTDAARIAMNEPHFSRRKELLVNVAASWVDTDADGFLEFVDQTENRQTREMLRLLATEHLAAYDPERTMKLIASGSDIREKTIMIGRVAQIMASENPEEALAWLGKFDADTQQAAMPQMLSIVARANPELARSYIDGQVANNELAGAIATVIESMAITDPAGAMEWANSLHTPHLVRSSHTQLYQYWAENDPLAAFETAMAEPRTDIKTLALDEITSTWSYDDPQAFLEWATQQQGEYGSYVYEKAIFVLNQMDAQVAAQHYDQIVAKHMAAGGSPEDYNELASEISSMMPTPETAFQWATSRATPAMRETSLKESAARWATENPKELTRGLEGLDPATAATIRAAAARELVSTDPEPALKMAAGIEDPELRKNSLARTYAHALEISEEKATHMLKQLQGITPEEVEQIIAAAQEYQ